LQWGSLDLAENQPLKGAVVEVLTNYKVAINLGKVNGAKKGMKFVIYEEGKMIKDVNGQDLEKIEIPKGFVEVTLVQDKISIAESFRVEKRIYTPFSGVAEYMSREVITTEKIPLAEGIPEEQKPSQVKFGDLVRQDIG
jgi:hypothetical protein